MKYLLFISLFLTNHCIAQKDTLGLIQKPLFVTLGTSFKPNYLGFQIGIFQLKKQKIVKRFPKSNIKISKYIGGELGFYSQKYVQNGFFSNLYWTRRTTFAKGTYLQIKPQIGLVKTFLNEESYSVIDNTVKLNAVKGDFYISGGLGLAVGKSFQKGIIRAIEVGGQAIVFYPNFRFISLRPAFQTTMYVPISVFKTINTKVSH